LVLLYNEFSQIQSLNLKKFKDTCFDLALSEIDVREEGKVKFTPVDKFYMLSNTLGIAF